MADETGLSRIEQRFVDFKEAHYREHELLQCQVREARDELRIKLAEMNEIRRQIGEERALFELREHSEVLQTAINIRISTVENMTSGMQGRLLGIGLAITVFVVLVEIGFRLLGK